LNPNQLAGGWRREQTKLSYPSETKVLQRTVEEQGKNTITKPKRWKEATGAKKRYRENIQDKGYPTRPEAEHAVGDPSGTTKERTCLTIKKNATN
jgi:hypothetical protein